MPLILGIETSCDETAAAVVENGLAVRSSIIASQHDLHAKYGGVVPEIASRAHLERIMPVLEQALAAAGVALGDLDAIAVGNRPGLIGSLLVGVSAAKTLAWAMRKPLIGVDHVRAHLYGAAMAETAEATERRPRNGDEATKGGEPETAPGSRSTLHAPRSTLHGLFPALGLVVSGGHTSLYELDSPLEMKLLGRTIDDAVGEAYDKAAVILQVGYPGGPKLDKLAREYEEKSEGRRAKSEERGAGRAYRSEHGSTERDERSGYGPHGGRRSEHDLPLSLLSPTSLDFSFSGLKTALLYKVRGVPRGRGGQAVFERSAEDLSDEQRGTLAAAFQRAAVETLMLKLARALDMLWAQGRPPRSLLIGGGVSANSLLRRRAMELGAQRGLEVRLPPMGLCLDNAAMIAGLAHEYLQLGRCDDLHLPAIATTSV